MTESKPVFVDKSIADDRAGKIIFVSHCVLNVNAKVRGIANYPAAMRPLVDLLLDNDVGIHQMRCPENTYVGSLRWGYVKEQYSSPMFLRHCRALAEETFDQVEEYRRAGYQVLGFVMMDGSPVCGLKKTPVPAAEGQKWGGMVWYIPPQEFADDSGVYCDALKAEAGSRGLTGIPFVSHPEIEELGKTFEESIADMKKQLKLK